MRVAVMGAGAVGGYFGAQPGRVRRHRRLLSRAASISGDATAWPFASRASTGTWTSILSSRPARTALLRWIWSSSPSSPRTRRKRHGPGAGHGPDHGGLVPAEWCGQCRQDRAAVGRRPESGRGRAYVSARVSAPGVIEHSGGGRIALGPLRAAGADHAHVAQINPDSGRDPV